MPRLTAATPFVPNARNVDTRYADPVEIPLGDGTTPISALKARAVLVDTLASSVTDTTLTPGVVRLIRVLGPALGHG